MAGFTTRPMIFLRVYSRDEQSRGTHEGAGKLLHVVEELKKIGSAAGVMRFGDLLGTQLAQIRTVRKMREVDWIIAPEIFDL